MGVKFALPVARIKYRGLFDYPKLLNAMRRWFLDNGYEFQERQIKHKVPSPAGYDQEMLWTGHKKISGYDRFNVRFRFHIWEIKEVDVVKKNKKTMMWNARVQIEMSSDVELDYNNYFERGNSRFLIGLRDWIHKFLLFNKITSGWTDELYYRVYKLHRITKESLGMSTSTDSSRYRY